MRRRRGFRGLGYSTSEHERIGSDWTTHISYRIVAGSDMLMRGKCDSALYEFIGAERELGNMACHLAGAHGGGNELNRQFNQFDKQLRVGVRKAVACLKGERE